MQSRNKHHPSRSGCQKENQHQIVNMSHNLCERTHKLHCDKSVRTFGIVNNKRTDIVMLDRTIREEYLIDVIIRNSYLYSTITEKLQKYADL